MDNKLEVILHLQKLLDTVPVAERQALNRRIAQLSMDYLVNNIRLEAFIDILESCDQRIKETRIISSSEQRIYQEIY